jgi:oligoendopeptidase F
MDRFQAIPREKKRHYVSENFDFLNVAAVVAVIAELENRPIGSVDQLVQWMKDDEEFGHALDEVASIAYIEYTCATDDEEKEKRKDYFEQTLLPELAPRLHALNLKYWNCPHRAGLDQEFWALHNKSIEAEIKLFREENIPLETEISKLSSEYQKIIGAMTVEWNGEEKTLPQMAQYIADPDRAVRERAWRLVSGRRYSEEAKLEALFDRMLVLRSQIAKNAGFANYRDYIFVDKERWDYTPADCEAFHVAVRDAVLPLFRAMQKQRREKLGLDVLRPWDTEVDEDGEDPLKPFTNAEELRSGVLKIYQSIDPRLADMFSVLLRHNLLDLDSRKGKAPGGYQSDLKERGLPFIFMNAAGTSDDVITLLHEGGHSFHTLQTRNMEWGVYRHPGHEFAEVASMSMELLGAKYFREFYTPEEETRAWQELLERVIWLFAWVAQVDAFQHWIYTTPGHTASDRRAKWVELSRTYSGDIDYAGLEELEQTYWHRQLHIFELPFYYIEYAIAQLGALQVWRNSLLDERSAVNKYLAGLALGGSQPLPKLFRAAGANFGFTLREIEPLVGLVSKKLNVRID